MTIAPDRVMTEHPAWLPTDGGHHRVIPAAGQPWLVTATATGTRVERIGGNGEGPVPALFRLPDQALPDAPELAGALRGLGLVARYPNGSLWDAIGTAIIRQVIRAAQAQRMYRAFCAAYGEEVTLPDGTVYRMFPAASKVAALTAEEFASVGMAFKARAMTAAAGAYLTHGETWRRQSPRELAVSLQSVPRIGPWTAHAAVADWSNDWASYPYADLAVRTWAAKAAPSMTWPGEESAFGEHWLALSGTELSTTTLLTLAWGNHHGAAL